MASALHAPYPADIPIAEYVCQRTAPQIGAAAAERQFIYMIERKHVPVIVSRRTPIASYASVVLNIGVAAAVRISHIGKVTRVGIRHSEVQARGEALFQVNL